jgi:hypothetical protein
MLNQRGGLKMAWSIVLVAFPKVQVLGLGRVRGNQHQLYQSIHYVDADRPGHPQVLLLKYIPIVSSVATNVTTNMVNMTNDANEQHEGFLTYPVGLGSNKVVSIIFYNFSI